MARRNPRTTSSSRATPFSITPSKSSLSRSSPPHFIPPIILPPQNNCFNFRIKRLFETLDIKPSSSKQKDRLTYMLLARRYHPDKWNIDISEYSFETSVVKFKKLSNAFDELIQSNILF